MKILEMNQKVVKATSIDQLREAYGKDADSVIKTLSLALGRHLLLRVFLDKKDANGYERANALLAEAIEAFPNTSINMNQRGWATRLSINLDGRAYYVPLTKRTWTLCAQYALGNSAETSADEIEPVDPDNDEYDDEVIVESESQNEGRFTGICRTVAEMKDALFGTGRYSEVYVIHGDATRRLYVSLPGQSEYMDFCFFNDGLCSGLPENRELEVVDDVLESLDRFGNEAKVSFYAHEPKEAFYSLSRPWWGREAFAGIDEDGATHVFFKLVEER